MALASSSAQSEQPEFPRIRSLNLDNVEMFYDVDLDELTVLFYGTQRRHTLRETGDHIYALVDPHSREMVGVELHHFMKRFVPRDPSLGAAVALATILSEEANGTTASMKGHSMGMLDRVYDQWKKIATPRRVELREILGALQSLSSSGRTSQP